MVERIAECVAESVAEHIGDRRRVGDGRKMVVDLGRTSEMVAWVYDVCLELPIMSGCMECTSKKCRAHYCQQVCMLDCFLYISLHTRQQRFHDK